MSFLWSKNSVLQRAKKEHDRVTSQKFSLWFLLRFEHRVDQLDHLYLFLNSNEILHNTSAWSSNLLKGTS